MSLESTASQTVGPYFAIGYADLVITELPAAPGETGIVIHGRVFDGHGQPVPDAVIEIWQADGHGHYPHPDDPAADQVPPGFGGFMRAIVNDQGEFTLRTVKPGRVAGPDGAWQAPHLAVHVLMRGLLKQAPTRIYFADEAAANEQDPVLARVPPARRPSLLARQLGADGYVWELHMQGDQETVFFSF